MRIFLTGANGFIGSKLVHELIGAGHQVLGLTRSDVGAHSLLEAGAEAHRGDLEDLDSLRSGAAACEGVIHTAFDHDFSNFVANCQKDSRAIAALGSALEGSARPLVITSGVGMGSAGPGQLATEDRFDLTHPNPRIASELAGRELSERGVNVSVVRLAQIHDTHKQGLVTEVIKLARQQGRAAYVGEGSNRCSAAPVTDTVRLYRLALEAAKPGSRYHAVAEEGVAGRAIAEAIGHRLGMPTVSLTPAEAPGYFGWLGMFAGADMAASSALTRQQLGWTPTGAGLLSDLAHLELQDA